MLFSVPLFDPTTYINPPSSYEFGLDLLANLNPGTVSFNYAFKYYIEEELLSNTPIIYVTAGDIAWQDDNTDWT